MPVLVHELIYQSAEITSNNEALRYKSISLSYSDLFHAVINVRNNLINIGLSKHDRIATFLPKCIENVVTLFAASAAGGIFVPINPLLKPNQVSHILSDCDVSILLTSSNRLNVLQPQIISCKSLKTIISIDKERELVKKYPQFLHIPWEEFINTTDKKKQNPIKETDVASIIYTSGSTGSPKGVVLTHKNMVLGAKSVAQYLGNRSSDRILALLPLSFDYGFSQLSTAFSVGACTVLINYMLPMEVIKTLQKESITGVGAVPPLWNILVQLPWPKDDSLSQLRYITNSGGVLPNQTINQLQTILPETKLYLMYGLTEAFRSTYLHPEEIKKRPTSMGKAIPNAEIWVLRNDGTVCLPHEHGELVHSGPLVSSGYWNDPFRTNQRFKELPPSLDSRLDDRRAVWSGDIVRMDDEGYLYYIGRNDDLIKTSGYRVSTTEVEEVLYASGLISEAIVLGIPDYNLGQLIATVVVPKSGTALCKEVLLDYCRREMSSYMVPAIIEIRDSIPRDPNGKIERQSLANEFLGVANSRDKVIV